VRLVESVQPTVEPVSVAELKEHLRIDFSDDDVQLAAMIKAARATVENKINRALITRTYIGYLDNFPSGRVVYVPYPKLQSVTTLKYYDTANVLQTLSATYYAVDVASDPGRIILKDGYSWPSNYYDGNAVVITFKAGYGDDADDVPQDLRHAVLLYAGWLYQNREDVGVESATVRAVDALAMPYKVYTTQC